MEIYDNDLIETEWTDEDHNVIIRKISIFKKSDYNEIANKFINIRTFTYTNTLYGELIDDAQKELQKRDKLEIKAILEGYLREIEKTALKLFNDLDAKQIIDEFGFDKEEVDSKTREELFSQIRGGQYCEMLLSYLAVELGFKKILPKPYFEWGYLSPTGIDVPYIDVENKKLLLGECKLYKNIKTALKSCYTDLDKIYNGDKLDDEIIEWQKKIRSIPDEIATIIEEKISDKNDLLDYVNEIVILGFVIGNKCDNLKDELKKFEEFSLKNKISVYLVSIPIENKDSFVEACSKVIRKMKSEVEDNG